MELPTIRENFVRVELGIPVAQTGWNSGLVDAGTDREGLGAQGGVCHVWGRIIIIMIFTTWGINNNNNNNNNNNEYILYRAK